jgi:hypothetical protein
MGIEEGRSCEGTVAGRKEVCTCEKGRCQEGCGEEDGYEEDGYGEDGPGCRTERNGNWRSVSELRYSLVVTALLSQRRWLSTIIR